MVQCFLVAGTARYQAGNVQMTVVGKAVPVRQCATAVGVELRCGGVGEDAELIEGLRHLVRVRGPVTVEMAVDAAAGAEIQVHRNSLCRSAARRVGKEGVSSCQYRWSQYHKKKKN